MIEVNLEDVQDLLFTSKDSLPAYDFVALIVSIGDNSQAYHAGLLIHYSGKLYIFHFDKQSTPLDLIENFSVGKPLFYKITNVIHPKLVLSFLNHCRLIEHTSKPKYGMFYTGTYYHEGTYFSETGFPEIMTCVGFCLNVITGFIEERQYLSFEDWEAVGVKAEKYFNDRIDTFRDLFPHISVDEFLKGFRRIKPIDLLSTGYFHDLPIRKLQTDVVKPYLEEKIRNTVV